MQTLSEPQSFCMLTESLLVTPPPSLLSCLPRTGERSQSFPPLSGSEQLSWASRAVSLSRTLGCSLISVSWVNTNNERNSPSDTRHTFGKRELLLSIQNFASIQIHPPLTEKTDGNSTVFSYPAPFLPRPLPRKCSVKYLQKKSFSH